MQLSVCQVHIDVVGEIGVGYAAVEAGGVRRRECTARDLTFPREVCMSTSDARTGICDVLILEERGFVARRALRCARAMMGPTSAR